MKQNKFLYILFSFMILTSFYFIYVSKTRESKKNELASSTLTGVNLIVFTKPFNRIDPYNDYVGITLNQFFKSQKIPLHVEAHYNPPSINESSVDQFEFGYAGTLQFSQLHKIHKNLIPSWYVNGCNIENSLIAKHDFNKTVDENSIFGAVITTEDMKNNNEVISIKNMLKSLGIKKINEAFIYKSTRQLIKAIKSGTVEVGIFPMKFIPDDEKNFKLVKNFPMPIPCRMVWARSDINQKVLNSFKHAFDLLASNANVYADYKESIFFNNTNLTKLEPADWLKIEKYINEVLDFNFTVKQIHYITPNENTQD